MSEKQVVFLVDDDSEVLKSLGMLLSTQGFQVVSFESAEKFLQSERTACVGCVITDLKMPGMDGDQLQEILQAEGSPLAVIVVSGHVDVPTAVKLMREGAVTVLEKPFKSAALLSAVEKALAKSRETLVPQQA